MSGYDLFNTSITILSVGDQIQSGLYNFHSRYDSYLNLLSIWASYGRFFDTLKGFVWALLNSDPSQVLPAMKQVLAMGTTVVN